MDYGRKVEQRCLCDHEQKTCIRNHPYDVGQFGERYFTYVAAFGAFTKTSYATPQSIKNALGRVAYILEGVQELSSIHKEHIRIKFPGEVLEDDYIFGAICNSNSVGGILTLSPSLVDMSDGKFEILLIRVPRSIQELHECIVALRTPKYDCGIITFRLAETLNVSASPQILLSLDGEKTDFSGQIRIETCVREFIWCINGPKGSLIGQRPFISALLEVL